MERVPKLCHYKKKSRSPVRCPYVPRPRPTNVPALLGLGPHALGMP